jgi:hypothetical protein
MTNNEAGDVQDYVNSISVSPHIANDEQDAHTGMLGMGPIGSLAVTVLLFWIIAYVFGIINTYRTKKKWLIPNARYWMNNFQAAGIWMKSIAGIATPKPQIERSDAYYYNPTQDEFDEALLVTHQLMIDGGWTIAGYLRRSKDCEDYAMKMAVEVRNYIATTWTEKVGEKGVAVGNIGYVRDSDGAGHVIVSAVIGNEVKYYEPYPGEKYLKEKAMTQKELDSINMSIM